MDNEIYDPDTAAKISMAYQMVSVHRVYVEDAICHLQKTLGMYRQIYTPNSTKVICLIKLIESLRRTMP
ncbi:MAG: hypothetical protein FWE38_01790 [Firmicutes bacterium]|nr:hypothetical protein [Bacillota bacterium]